MSGALAFEPDTYYEVRSFEIEVEGDDGPVALRRGEVVLCIGFTSRGNKRFAGLVVRRDDVDVLLQFRVSRFNRGKGNWRELNPMLALALADKIPTL